MRRPTAIIKLMGAALAALTALAGLGGCDADAPSLRADRLWLGENIITLDEAHEEATAVATKGGRILWVGRREDWRGEAAEVTELGDNALLPGFIDAHGHISFSARTLRLANVASPPVGTVVTIPVLQDTLRTYLQERGFAPGDWVVGMGYDDSLIEEQRHPNRDDLDAVSRDHPIALIHVSGHLAAMNSAALGRIGYGAGTPDPPGGVIRRWPHSREPDGVVEEAAIAPLFSGFLAGGGIPAEDIHAALASYARHGITTVQDGAASLDDFAHFAKVAAAEGLALDIIAYPRAMADDFALPDDLPAGVYRNRLKIGGVKLILDGSPQGKTAYLSEPYFIPPPGLPEDYRGYPSLPQEAVDTLVARFVSANVPMLVHCNGDAAADMLLNALAQTDARASLGDHRTVMIHAQTVRDDQIDRMASLGITPSYFSAHTFYWGDWHRDSVLGPQRAARISPTRATLDRGVPFTVHNDSPIVPPHMIRLLWATVNRITRSGQVLGAEQRIPVIEALRAMTVQAAYQAFEEDVKGTLTPGKQADLVVLSQNPLHMRPEDLLSLEIVQTVSRGVPVFVADMSASR